MNCVYRKPRIKDTDIRDNWIWRTLFLIPIVESMLICSVMNVIGYKGQDCLGSLIPEVFWMNLQVLYVYDVCSDQNCGINTCCSHPPNVDEWTAICRTPDPALPSRDWHSIPGEFSVCSDTYPRIDHCLYTTTDVTDHDDVIKESENEQSQYTPEELDQQIDKIM